MLYKLWEDGQVASLDDPFEKYAENFTIKNPLGRSSGPGPASPWTPRTRFPSLTLRRMASQLSGLPRRLRETNLLWSGDTQAALELLKDDILVADPGTKCHYSNVAFSLLAKALARWVAASDFESWRQHPGEAGLDDTGFDITPDIQAQMAVGVYANGQPAPLYDLGWYRPAGQMYSTAADMAKLSIALLGVSGRSLLRDDTLRTLLTPTLRCHAGYFANATGTPWEANELLGYDVLRKDGDLDGYAATLSLVPRLNLGLVVLMAGVRPQQAGQDLVNQAYGYLLPAMKTAFRGARHALAAPPSSEPYVGLFTYRNMTFYEIKADADGTLVMQQFGPQMDPSVPSKYRTIRLDYLEDRVFRVVFEQEYPCRLKVNAASVSLEAQDRQLFNFYPFSNKGVSPGFDSPGLNTYRVIRIAHRPYFPS
ncbi:LOW QUALITY PROTEIN: hypothetical protein CRUP_018073 [Coryphaenoides rupestris]|nr:LOW QUALITY PROTEIN: hypothetical protein CRUP_018073 [Coryphaenoides rupestris]